MNVSLTSLCVSPRFSHGLCFFLSLDVSLRRCVVLPRLSQAAAPPARQSQLAIHQSPHSVPGVSLRVQLPNSDRRPHLGGGLGLATRPSLGSALCPVSPGTVSDR